MIYSWNIKIYQSLTGRLAKFPSALLISGLPGVGKKNLSLSISHRLLCREATGLDACGHCKDCRLLAADSHPDFIFVTPNIEDGKIEKTIKIEQLRELSERLLLTNHQGGRRVVMISPAEAMTVSSANALLKMLEEPPLATHIILVSAHPDRLLPTIRSRCQSVLIPTPQFDLALPWVNDQVGEKAGRVFLALAAGAPCEAVLLAEHHGQVLVQLIANLRELENLDPVAVAGKWSEELEPMLLASCLQKWIHDLATVKAGGQPRYYANYLDALQSLSRQMSLTNILEYYQHDLNEHIKHMAHPLNKQSQLEALLCRYNEVLKPPRRASAANH